MDLLARLPVDDMYDELRYLHRTFLSEAVQLLTYYDGTYITETFLSRQRRNQAPELPTINLRRIPERFSPTLGPGTELNK